MPERPEPEQPAPEPTNAELARRDWPRLPASEEEGDDRPDTWWERQVGYDKFRRMYANGHDELVDAIAEHRRLVATSDHRWILAQDDARRWYNYTPAEYVYRHSRAHRRRPHRRRPGHVRDRVPLSSQR